MVTWLVYVRQNGYIANQPATIFTPSSPFLRHLPQRKETKTFKHELTLLLLTLPPPFNDHGTLLVVAFHVVLLLELCRYRLETPIDPSLRLFYCPLPLHIPQPATLSIPLWLLKSPSSPSTSSAHLLGHVECG